MLDRAALGVISAEIEPAHTRQSDCSGTHGAGLERDIEIRVGQALLTQAPRRGLQDQQLGVSCGILQFLDTVVVPGQHFTAQRVNQNRADRHFANAHSLSRLLQRQRHGVSLGHRQTLDPSQPTSASVASAGPPVKASCVAPDRLRH
jgi:hypothetical protein